MYQLLDMYGDVVPVAFPANASRADAIVEAIAWAIMLCQTITITLDGNFVDRINKPSNVPMSISNN